MNYKQLKINKKGNILEVVISRPQALNALNTTFFDEMDRLLVSEARDPEIKVMLLSGEGKAFVAGADIAEMVDMTSAQGKAFSQKGQNTFASIEKLEIPVIAVVNGFALGGGLELAMACDFRIAGEKAKFGQPEVNLGLIPGYAGTQRLSRLTGLGNALYLLMTAEMINAEEALRIGLVQKVVPQEDLMQEAEKIATIIAQKGPKAVKKVKQVCRHGMNSSFEEGSLMESEEFGSLFGNEGTIGMKAFLDKKQANWNE